MRQCDAMTSCKNFMCLLDYFPISQSFFMRTSSTVIICRPRWLSWMCVRLVIRRLRVRPPPSRKYSFAEIDHEIISTISFSLPLILKGQLSVSGDRMGTVLVNNPTHNDKKMLLCSSSNLSEIKDGIWQLHDRQTDRQLWHWKQTQIFISIY